MDEIPELKKLKELFDNVRGKLTDLCNKYVEIDKNQNNQELSKEVRDQWERDLFDLKWIVDCLNKDSHPVDLIVNFYYAGDRLYCLSVYDILSNAIKILYDTDKDNTKDIYEKIIWLGECLYKHDFDQSGNTEQKRPNHPDINKEYLHKLDGMDVLLTNLGEDKFIQLALAGSYFFDTKLVKYSTSNLYKAFQASKDKGKQTNDIINQIIENKESFVSSDKSEYVQDFLNKKKDCLTNKETEVVYKNKEINKFVNNITKKNFKDYLFEKNEIKDTLKASEKKEQLDNKLEGKLKNCIDEFKTYQKKLINELCYLKARYTIDKNIVGEKNKLRKGNKALYKFEKKYYRVDIDMDGNRAVRELITKETGVTVAQGKDSILQNTIISHVWGRAYDPRYFTSLWNIVLIPAWANSLMDKEDAPKGTLASKMRATYMTICTQLYNSEGGVFPKNCKHNKESVFGSYLSKLPEIANEDDAISEKCTYNIISEKNYGKIVISKNTSLLKVGKLAEKIIPIIQSDSFPEDELKKMTQKDESKKLFGLNFPALVKAENIKEPKRFYKKVIKIKGNEYYLCSQWYEQDREKLNKWLKRHNYSLL